MTFHVDSEVGRLAQAIEHRPEVESSRLTPAYADVRVTRDPVSARHGHEEVS